MSGSTQYVLFMRVCATKRLYTTYYKKVYNKCNDFRQKSTLCYLILDSRMMNIKIAFIYKKFKES
jgi:hypothetical protein